MSEIDNKWIDGYFKKRPQLTPPTKGRFGYEIPGPWFEIVLSLLQIVERIDISNKTDTNIRMECGFLADTCIDCDEDCPEAGTL